MILCAITDGYRMRVIVLADARGIRRFGTWECGDDLLEMRHHLFEGGLGFRVQGEHGGFIPPMIQQAREKPSGRIGGEAFAVGISDPAENAVVVQTDPRSAARKPLLQPVLYPAVLDHVEQGVNVRLIDLRGDDVAEAGQRGMGRLMQDQPAAVIR